MWDSVRKFRLEYCDLPTMLYNVSVMLRVHLLNIDNGYKKRIPLVYYIVTAVVAASYFYVYLFSVAWFVFVRGPQTGDLVAALKAASFCATSGTGTIKLMFMFIYRDKVRKLIEKYLNLDASVKFGSRFSFNMMKILREVKKRAVIFWIVIIGNGLVYVMKPLFKPGKHQMEDSFTIYGFEPNNESPNYEIVYLLTTAAIAFICYLPANITAFLIITAGYTEAQMLALSEEILNFWDDAQQHYLDHQPFDTEDSRAQEARDDSIVVSSLQKQKTKITIINEYIRNRLFKFVNIHTTNINVLHQVENIYREAIAIEFMLLVIGLILKLLAGPKDMYLEIPYSLMPLANVCLTGQRVMDASVVFENAVYGCKWENFDVSNMRMVLLMLQSSQKPMTLSAGGVTMLSFKFTNLLITSPKTHKLPCDRRAPLPKAIKHAIAHTTHIVPKPW